MKTLRCRDLGYTCGFEAQGTTVEEILQKAAKHATEDHKLVVTPQMAEAVKQKIREA